MYIHSYSRVSDSQEIFNLISENGFGILVSTVDTKLWASHIPLVLSADGAELTGHVSRGNKASKNFSNGEEVLCIFQGAHTYISSSWYNHENVPTWNYQAAHVYGTLHVLEGDALLQSLKALTNKYEQHSEKPVTIEGMNADYLHKEMKGIVGFKIAITQVEASFKLSQNRDTENYRLIIENLEKRGDSQSLLIAEEMKKNKR